MKTLTFMLIGVQKAGTTALASFLAEHPDICMSRRKEVHVFDKIEISENQSTEFINQFYSEFFTHYVSQRELGEATPAYIYVPEIIPAINKYNEKLKLIVLLRDPLERAISHYLMELDRGNESHSILFGFLFEKLRYLWRSRDHLPDRHNLVHSYLSRGLYVKQLQHLRKYFLDEQILIVEQSELMDFHETTMTKVFNFLNVDSSVIPEWTKVFETSKAYGRQVPFKYFFILYFRFKNRKLKGILAEMGYEPEWPWLL